MKTHTRKARPTLYGLACGHIEELNNCSYNKNLVPISGVRLTLEMDGGIHIKLFDHGAHKRIHWETFDKLIEARSFYDKLAKEYFGLS